MSRRRRVSESRKDSPATSNQVEQLKLVYDYAKFHIGLYAALIAGIAALLQLSPGLKPEDVACLRVAVVLILVAGLAGGMVATGVLDTGDARGVWRVPASQPDRTSSLLDSRPRRRGVPLKSWILVEHTAFWCAVAVGLYPILKPW